jgi:alpha-ketoglutarate-dependent taurine dioxygenase
MTVPTLTAFDLDSIRAHLRSEGRAYIRAVPEGFDYLKGLTRLGLPAPQYGGALVRDVRPDPAICDDVVSAANMAELTPHTEWYEFPGPPPRYVALWCVQPAAGPGGETTLADGYALLDQFTTAEHELLMSNVCRWRSRPTLAREGVTQVAHHPILETHAGEMLLRFSTLDLNADDDLSARYVTCGREFFETTKIAVKIERGAILIWDNWRMLHARNAFSDPRRHLRRVLIGATAYPPEPFADSTQSSVRCRKSAASRRAR